MSLQDRISLRPTNDPNRMEVVISGNGGNWEFEELPDGSIRLLGPFNKAIGSKLKVTDHESFGAITLDPQR